MARRPRGSRARGVAHPIAAALLCHAALVLGAPPSALAQESITNSAPAPDSVSGLRTPIEAEFAVVREKPPRFPRLKKKLSTYPPFLRDLHLILKPRNYFLRRRYADGTISEAYALGASFAWESGWLMDRIKVGGEFSTSQRLYGPLDRDGTGLLRRGQLRINVLDQAYGVLKLTANHRVTAYRQIYALPYVNENDSRMIPNTFEGYDLKGEFERQGRRPKIEYIVGYIARMKKRGSDAFVSMAEAAGVSGDPGEGTVMAGARISPTDKLSLGAVDFYTPNTLNIFYAEGSYERKFTKELSGRVKAQFTDQRSVGSDQLTGFPFDTRVGGAELAVSYMAAVLRGGFSITDREANIRSPFGASPGYASLMVSDFDSAGEKAWLLGFSYDFKRVGLKGLSAFANLSVGSGIVDPATGARLPGERELDVTVDYHLQKGRLKGFWVRLRGAFVDQGGPKAVDNEYRAILNYEVPLL